MFAWTFHQEYELMTPPVGPRSSSRGNRPPRSLILTARLYRVRLSCEVLTTAPELSMLSTLETTVSGKLIPRKRSRTDNPRRQRAGPYATRLCRSSVQIRSRGRLDWRNRKREGET